MFVSFNKVFNKKPQSQTEVPQAMLDYMNQTLPKGMKYVSDQSGTCSIVSEENTVIIGGIVYKPTEEQKKILGDNFSCDDITSYFYNAQKPMPLELLKDGTLTLNGQELPIEKISYNPLLPVKYVSGSLMAFPQPFPKPFSLLVGNGTYSRELRISRIPNESVNIASFQSDKDEPFVISYTIDNATYKSNINISLNLKSAKSVRDVVESVMIYNAFILGEASIGGALLDKKFEAFDAKLFDEKSALFWEKVLRVEECLNVHFVPPKDEVHWDDAILVEKIYQNLINKIPVRDNQKLDSINGDWDLHDANRDIADSIGKTIYFFYDSEIKIELFETQFTLWKLTGVGNAKIKEIRTENEKAKLILEDESEVSKRYMCSLFFLKKEDLDLYREKDINEIAHLFKSAKNIQDYL